MDLTHFETIIAVLSAIIVMLGVLAGGLRWIYKQGVSSQTLINSVDENTVATEKLTKSFDRFTEKTNGTLLDHEKRITRIEAAGWVPKPEDHSA